MEEGGQRQSPGVAHGLYTNSGKTDRRKLLEDRFSRVYGLEYCYIINAAFVATEYVDDTGTVFIDVPKKLLFIYKLTWLQSYLL